MDTSLLPHMGGFAFQTVSELQTLYEQIVQSNAGVERATEWVQQCVQRLLLNPSQINLVGYSTTTNTYDCDTLRRFLSPYGTFWQVLLWLELQNARLLLAVVSEPRSVSAVEYYLYNLAEHVCLGSQSRVVCNPYSMEMVGDNVYLSLLSDYVSFFLPSTGPFPLADMTGAGPHEIHIDSHEEQGNKSKQFFSPLGLFKRNVFKNNSHNVYLSIDKSGRAPVHPSDVLWKSWTFVRVLLEVWLRVDDRAPSLMRVTAVRYLIKHTHSFVFAPTTPGNTALVEFKQLLLHRLVQPLLLPAINHQFNHWPLDASFRHVLELWLSYIQPWRYTSGGNLDSGDRWQGFVNQNVQYYWLLIPLVRRLLRMDLDSLKNIMLVSRLVKVFCGQPLLLQMIDTASGTDRMAPTPTRSSTSWASESFEKDSRHLRDLMADLLLKVQETLVACRKRQELIRTKDSTEGKSVSQSFFASLFFDDGPTNNRANDEQKVLEQLQCISSGLSEAFSLPVPSLSEEHISSLTPVRSSDSQTPDYYRDSRTGLLKLTPSGREQVRNNQARFKLDGAARAVIPADLAPIGRGEVGCFVRGLHVLSCWLNNQWPVEQLSSAYWNEAGLLAKVSRQLLEPPSVPCPTASPSVCDRLPLLPPRLSLRSLASYRFLIILLLCVTCVIVLRIHPISMIVIFLLSVVGYNFARMLL